MRTEGTAEDRRPPRGRREVVSLHPALGARYVALVAGVASSIEAGLSNSVCANRVAFARAGVPALRLRPWREERRVFACRLERLVGGGGGLVFADVRACYASIGPAVVEASLRRLLVGSRDAAEVGRFLRRLGELGVRGLPIGPEPSAVLANAVLSAVDRATQRRGWAHVRWVDDVAIAFRRPEEVPAMLDELRSILARSGLELNERKTRIVVSGGPLVAPELSASDR